MNRKNLMLLYKAVAIILLYFIWPTIFNELFNLFGFKNNILFVEFSKILLIPLLFMIYKSDFKDDLIEFDKNKWKNILRTSKYFVILVLLISFMSYILELLANQGLITYIEEISNNQNTVKLLEINTFLSGLLLIIIYPVVEEIVFKKPLKDVVKNKWMFIIISSIAYGYFNIALTIDGINSLIYILPYATISSVGAYYYYKTDNIIYPISLRVIYNIMVFTVNVIPIIIGANL